jgi:hypothetical protein
MAKHLKFNSWAKAIYMGRWTVKLQGLVLLFRKLEWTFWLVNIQLNILNTRNIDRRIAMKANRIQQKAEEGYISRSNIYDLPLYPLQLAILSGNADLVVLSFEYKFARIRSKILFYNPELKSEGGRAARTGSRPILKLVARHGYSLVKEDESRTNPPFLML